MQSLRVLMVSFAAVGLFAAGCSGDEEATSPSAGEEIQEDASSSGFAAEDPDDTHTDDDGDHDADDHQESEVEDFDDWIDMRSFADSERLSLDDLISRSTHVVIGSVAKDIDVDPAERADPRSPALATFAQSFAVEELLFGELEGDEILVRTSGPDYTDAEMAARLEQGRVLLGYDGFGTLPTTTVLLFLRSSDTIIGSTVKGEYSLVGDYQAVLLVDDARETAGVSPTVDAGPLGVSYSDEVLPAEERPVGEDLRSISVRDLRQRLAAEDTGDRPGAVALSQDAAIEFSSPTRTLGATGTIDIKIAGAAANQFLFAVQCLSDASGPLDCHTVGAVTLQTDASGATSASVPIVRSMADDSKSDCALVKCELVVSDGVTRLTGYPLDFES